MHWTTVLLEFSLPRIVANTCEGQRAGDHGTRAESRMLPERLQAEAGQQWKCVMVIVAAFVDFVDGVAVVVQRSQQQADS